jgi:hypothetical protein
VLNSLKIDSLVTAQIVARTKRHMSKLLQGQIILDKMLQCFMTQYICASANNFVENDDKE